MALHKFIDTILFVVVLYKQNWTKTSLYSLYKNSILQGAISVFIYDNSLHASPHNSQNIFYKHDPLNSGVSKAYNEAGELATTLNKQWMLILDQDTQVNLQYLQELYMATQRHKNSVAFVPKLHDAIGMVSPFRWQLAKGKRALVKQDKLSLNKFRFANSGLLVQCDAFHAVNGYEESIALDFSDIAFGEKLRQLTDHFVVIDVTLKHAFSDSSVSNKEEALQRFAFFCSGAYAMGQQFGHFYLYYVNALLRSLKLTWHFKTRLFIKVFFRIFKYA